MKKQSGHIALTFSLIILFVLYSVGPAWALAVGIDEGGSLETQEGSAINEGISINEVVITPEVSKPDLPEGVSLPDSFTIGKVEVTNVTDLTAEELLLLEMKPSTPESQSELGQPALVEKKVVDISSGILEAVPLSVSEVIATASPSLTVMVSVINDDNGKNRPEDFIINISGGSANPSTFRGSSTGTKIEISPKVNYALSVPTLTYQATLSEGCQGNLAEGKNAVCQISLNDVQRGGINEALNNIINPDVEIAGNEISPKAWITGGYGTNNRLFTYPVLGRDSDQAINVRISSYTDGDAKWYFEKVPVVAGHSYQFSNIYSADAPSDLTVEYFDQNQNHLSFGGFITVPKTNGTGDWQSARATFVPPTGAYYLTVFQSLKSVGSLSTDKFSLIEIPQPKSFNQGFVSVVFDDGLDSQFKNAFPKLSLADIKGTFYLITHAISGLSIQNAKLDNPGDEDGNFNWKAYMSPAEYTYPVQGRTGTAAYAKSLEINSNAAWFFDPIEVINDSVYSFSEWYKSTTNTELVAVINKLDGTSVNADVTDENGITLADSVQLPSTDNTWREVKTHFYIPSDTKNVTVVNRLKGIGEVTIDDVAFGAVANIDKGQVQTLLNGGQEIGLHTRSHKDLTAISETAATNEIAGSMIDVIKNGFNQIFSFSYPYGLSNEPIERITERAGFTSGRSVVPGFNGLDTNPYKLVTQNVSAETSLSQIENWINQAHNDKTWLILVFHDVVDDLNNHPFGVTPEKLQSVLDYLNNNKVATKTVTEGIGLMDEGTQNPNPVLSKIIVSPDLPRGVVGDTANFMATAYDQNSIPLITQPTFTWSSSNSAVVKINSVTGFAEAVGPGTTVISAQSGSVTGSTQGTVDGQVMPIITTISISPSDPVGVIGDKANFKAVAYNQQGSEIAPNSLVVWKSSKPSVVSINPSTGEAVALSLGISQITATIGSVSGQTTATVLGGSNTNITLKQISVTHSANKLNYLVGESLNISGLKVSGLYSDGHIEKLKITRENITGFNSSSPAKDQVLTIMVAGKSTTYSVTIKSCAVSHHRKSGTSAKYINNFKDKLPGQVLGADRYKFNSTLKMGMQNEAVLELQRRLKEVHAFEGPITGYFGLLTKAAAEKFQAAYGLPLDGVIGPLTRNILNAS